jgi:hypothetical protein
MKDFHRRSKCIVQVAEKRMQMMLLSVHTAESQSLNPKMHHQLATQIGNSAKYKHFGKTLHENPV